MTPYESYFLDWYRVAKQQMDMWSGEYYGRYYFSPAGRVDPPPLADKLVNVKKNEDEGSIWDGI